MTKPKEKPPVDVPGAAVSEPAAPPTPDTPAPAPGGSLADLDVKVQAGGAPTDPGAAIRALGAPDAPAPEKNKGGRPKGSKNKASTPAGTPSPTAPAPAVGVRERDKTKAELLSENQALRARVEVQQAAGFTDADIENTKSAVVGLIVILNMTAEANHAPEFVHTDAEATQIGDAFKKPAAPLLAKAGKYADLVVACAVLAKIEWPKVQAYRERVHREKVEAERKRLEAGRPPVTHAEPATQREPSAAVLSGGVAP